ncbi:LCP family protein [Patescibacteria group bacterium]|nr:LCP family protein [Patescibacteria group bacterium]
MSEKTETMTTDTIVSPTAGSIFLKATLLSLAFATIMLFITAFGVGIWGFNKLYNFAKLANTSIGELKTTFNIGWNSPVTKSNDKKNFLILGVDSLEARPGSPALTDTIILLSLDIKSGQISTIPLPRDLWSNKYLTRINALYYYGQDKYPSQPEKFAKETIEDLTGISIHHTIVVSINSVTDIIDILGGVEVDVKTGFTDSQFPRPNVDVTIVKDPAKLYQTVVFEEGKQNMDGERVLQFIRSRKSGDDQGHDLARAERQQLVISTLVKRFQNFELLRDEKTLAELYKYYHKNFAQQFSIEEGIATIREILPIKNSITFKNNSISVFPDDKNGVITNPPTYKYKGEWIYEIRDENNFKNEIQDKLNLIPSEQQ